LSYGQAGAINFYRKKYNLPQPACLSGSFIFWAPDTIVADKAIMIEEQLQKGSDEFRDYRLVNQVRNPFARDRGYIYFGSDTIGDVAEIWRQKAFERKMQFSKKLKRAEKKRLKREEKEN
jgi:hypothetical protein